MLHDPAREFLQDAGDFPGDLKLGDFDLIVQVDEFTRLHEHRRPAGRNVMYDAMEIMLTLGFDRQNVPVLPLGIVRLLQEIPVT